MKVVKVKKEDVIANDRFEQIKGQIRSLLLVLGTLLVSFSGIDDGVVDSGIELVMAVVGVIIDIIVFVGSFSSKVNPTTAGSVGKAVVEVLFKDPMKSKTRIVFENVEEAEVA